jgi:rsbT co-antagonist protein RsbR
MAKQNKKDAASVQLRTPQMIKKKEKEILKGWLDKRLTNLNLRLDLINSDDLKKESKNFLEELIGAISTGKIDDINAPHFKPIVKELQNISRRHALLGFTPSETAGYIFSLKETLLEFIQKEYKDHPDIVNREITGVNKLLDRLGMVTVETYISGREELISGQKEALLEMTTPIMMLWEKILLLPLVGTVDSARAQLTMEMSLKKIAETESNILILDILGVPAVDTAVANHLLKIIKASRLMGCECILSGISPDVAQTIVKLGVDLGNLITKRSLKDSLIHALKLQGAQAQGAKVKK